MTERLEARLSTASPAPWVFQEGEQEDEGYVGMVWNEKGWWAKDSTIMDAQDAALIVELRNCAAELVAVVKAAEETVDKTSMIHPAGGLDELETALAALAVRLDGGNPQ